MMLKGLSLQQVGGMSRAQQNKLSAGNALRVHAVFRLAAGKLAVLGGITPDTRKEKIAQLVKDEIARVADAQRQLEVRYASLIAQQAQSVQAPSSSPTYVPSSRTTSATAPAKSAAKPKTKELQAAIDQLASDFRYATKVLCINLERCPDIAGSLLNIETWREFLRQLFEQTIAELNDKCSFNTLNKCMSDERASASVLAELTQKEKDNTVRIVKLAAELQVANDERERDKTRQAEEIARLREQLTELKSRTSVDSKLMRKEAAAKSESHQRTLKGKVNEDESQLLNLNKRLELEDCVHEQISTYLEEKHKKLQQDVNDWMNRYDQDTEEKIRQIDSLKQQKQQNLMKLYDLRERLKEYREIVTREKTALARREEQKKYEEKLLAASIKLQALWRGYKARKLYRAMLKKKAVAAKRKKRGTKSAGAGRGRGRGSRSATR
eukprot:TRINITY_DN5816_c0_g1_i2.p1 TRINITY_DN5816_c0_g1~~TRINITY_DN5816_c0_g1_i2.p1  ORF type:complete len:439 (+),score=176.68 TRINITY_DN5816_c0_g1_i2:3-1319(+)